MLPAADNDTNTMLNNGIYLANSFSVAQPIGNGTYQIYLWSIENYQANSRSFHVKLEGLQMTNSPIGSMPLNEWRKYGPYTVTVQDGVLNMELVKVTGDPNLAGMAIYSGDAAPLPPLDLLAPSAPGEVSVTSATYNSVSLTWGISTDNVGVTGYEVLQDGVVIGTTESTTLTVTGLTPNTTYRFTVNAKDAAGNVSNASNPLLVTTDPAPMEGFSNLASSIPKRFNGLISLPPTPYDRM